MVFSFLGSVLGGTSSSSSSESCRPYLEKWATCGRSKSQSHLTLNEKSQQCPLLDQRHGGGTSA